MSNSAAGADEKQVFIFRDRCRGEIAPPFFGGRREDFV